MPEEGRTKVGVGVTIMKDGKLLLHKRNGSHGAGEYASPGGHLEYLESFEDCARRETREECGIEITNIRFQFLANLTQYAPKHYVHVGLLADWKSGAPKNMEPDMGGDWEWFDMNNLPQPLFGTTPLMLESMNTGQNYFDA